MLEIHVWRGCLGSENAMYSWFGGFRVWNLNFIESSRVYCNTMSYFRNAACSDLIIWLLVAECNRGRESRFKVDNRDEPLVDANGKF